VKYLIVNGDDFGQAPGVTAGIIEAHVNGILTSTSLLVDTPFSRAAAIEAQTFRDLSVGLHLCLTDDRERLVFDLHDTTAVRAELRRQLDRFLTLVSAPPTHLDSQHNIHRDPRVTSLFLELADEHGLPLREHSPARYFSSFYGQWDGETHLEQIGVEMLERMLRTEVGDGVTELSCHPGRVDDHLDSFYAIERETELQALCAPRIRELLDDLGIVLIGFRELAHVSAAQR
jgi:predicted glycoside hydrolase/deacetylase ChbG (UPF0249 family)